MRFSEVMKQAIEKKIKKNGFTNSLLIRESGVSLASWYGYLQGTRQPNIRIAARIARVLDINLKIQEIE